MPRLVAVLCRPKRLRPYQSCGLPARNCSPTFSTSTPDTARTASSRFVQQSARLRCGVDPRFRCQRSYCFIPSAFLIAPRPLRWQCRIRAWFPEQKIKDFGSHRRISALNHAQVHRAFGTTASSFVLMDRVTSSQWRGLLGPRRPQAPVMFK